MGMDTKGLRRIRVKVTADDIAKGKADDCYSCPIALAMKRAGLWWPRVEGYQAFYGRGALQRKRAVLPREADIFIADFDSGEPVEPFTFDLDVIP